MCTAGPSCVVKTRRDPSGLKVAAAGVQESGLSNRASVRPVCISTRSRTLLASPYKHQAAVGRKRKTGIADRYYP